ncbi:hypothetical protein A3H78_01145 [Candidatus Roizmanbacteria bacterium RIFCSPLOWO2_02_FULL_36_11]|uniref:RNA helicase n=1 Tax=Candidatus Roizmanbacteria bacterium RIFCSPLOWO2_02_FULL_36_11 TaxID=1802071 RepID=A0A1F7JIL8_9BACT|nr:MAG: hypothetical protein A3H78_01145 [Candidatus Roizmanbacteria bacterium RIFCSPLOWO2_02_FULL_36_11]
MDSADILRPTQTPDAGEPRPRPTPADIPTTPIDAKAAEIKQAFAQYDSIVVIGETGSGKTTRIPIILRDVMKPEDRMVVTQPRRIAVDNTAERLAKTVGCNIGEEIGRQYRGKKEVGPNTRINVVVEGTLLRQLEQDSTLRDISIVMVDEVHERNVNTDILLGLLKKCQAERKARDMPALKIIATSATLEKEKVERYLQSGKTIEAEGRMHEIKDHYEAPRPDGSDPIPRDQMALRAAQRAKEIMGRTDNGHMFIFMPGKGEIDETIMNLRQLGLPGDIDILPLHSDLTQEEQHRIYENPGKRKIIVATNIAETSITVDNIRYVVDSGLVRQKTIDTEFGTEQLSVIKHTASGCKQRRGRAGRTAPGEYHALYAQNDTQLPADSEYKREQHQVPEILRSDLSHVVLRLKKAGVDDVRNFPLMDTPPAESFKQAIITLQRLGALDESEKITETGKLMAEFPVDPHVAKLIVAGRDYKCVDDALTIASFLSNKSVYPSGRDNAAILAAAKQVYSATEDAKKSDFVTMLNIWADYQTHKDDENWSKSGNGRLLNRKVLKDIADTRGDLVGAAQENNLELTKAPDATAVKMAVASVYADNLLLSFTDDYQYTHYEQASIPGLPAGHPEVKMDHTSVLYSASDPILICSSITKRAPLVAGRRLIPRATNSQVMTIAEMQQVRPAWVKETTSSPEYFVEHDQVGSRKELSLLGKKEQALLVPVVGEPATRAFAHALAAGRVNIPAVLQNKQAIDQINQEFRRQTKVIDKDLIPFDVVRDVYIAQIGTIASRRELEKALSEGRVDLSIDLDKLRSQVGLPPGEKSSEVPGGDRGMSEAQGAEKGQPQAFKKENFIKRFYHALKRIIKKIFTYD